jgi:hypothetical protein
MEAAVSPETSMYVYQTRHAIPQTTIVCMETCICVYLFLGMKHVRYGLGLCDMRQRHLTSVHIRVTSYS